MGDKPDQPDVKFKYEVASIGQMKTTCGEDPASVCLSRGCIVDVLKVPLRGQEGTPRDVTFKRECYNVEMDAFRDVTLRDVLDDQL